MSERDRRALPVPIGQVLDEISVDEAALWARVQNARRMKSSDVVLPVPVANVLQADLDLGPARARHWRAISARRHAPARDVTARRWTAALAAALAVALAVVGFPLLQGSPPSSGAAGQLTLASGVMLRAEEASESPRQLTLADASRITLQTGARIEQVRSSGTRFDLRLERGTADFSVTPHGPRRWTIDAGLAQVEVVGTEFRVERQQQSVRVSVSHGKVLVRNAALPDQVRYLTAGQSLEVSAPVETREATPPASVRNEAVAVAAPVPAASPARAPAMPNAPVQAGIASVPAPAPHLDWRADFAAGRFDAAYAKLGRAGLKRNAQRAADVDELLNLADVARLSGHARDAVYPLTRVLDAFHESPHAAVAAFTLGRVLLDELDAPREAARVFERAIGMRPPHALLEDSHARLVQAYLHAGDAPSAERAAARYRALFPSGRHVGDLERWMAR